MKYCLQFLGWILVSLFLVGCGETELYTGLPEREANMMIAVLRRRGMNCSKITGAENTYGVMVESDRFGEATEILREYGLPQATYNGVGTVFGKTGLVTSPTEERIRFMYALSQDIAATIAKIDGVTASDVHIVLPDNNPFSDITYPSSASVFVQYRPDSDVENYASQIKNLVASSVEGLTYDKVSLAMFKSSIAATSRDVSIEQAIKNRSLELAAQEEHRTRMGIIGGMCAVLLAAAGFILWKRRSKKKEASKVGGGPAA